MSWAKIPSDSDFSLFNLPFGIVTTPDDDQPHVAVALGDSVVDLKVLSAEASFQHEFQFLQLGGPHRDVFAQPTLNAFAALGRPVHREVRAVLQELLSDGTIFPKRDSLRANKDLCVKAILPQSAVKMCLPMAIGDYTDFYAGAHHARAVGALFRDPSNPLPRNYNSLPIAYHGRASSVVVSGTSVKRPVGQIRDPTGTTVCSTTQKLDFELELACIIAKPNSLSTSISVEDAEQHIFGYVLLNDWSARDIQSWEYVPLGPFNGKNFMTTISPWVVLADALEPFRVPAMEPPVPMMPYLAPRAAPTVFDLDLFVDLTTPQGDKSTITQVKSSHLQWSFPQMIAHHTLGGCPLRTGDLLATGTISGPPDAGAGKRGCGCLLEMTEDGKNEISVGVNGSRRFLEDGDAVTMRGHGTLESGHRVGFGECFGQVSS